MCLQIGFRKHENHKNKLHRHIFALKNSPLMCSALLPADAVQKAVLKFVLQCSINCLDPTRDCFVYVVFLGYIGEGTSIISKPANAHRLSRNGIMARMWM